MATGQGRNHVKKWYGSVNVKGLIPDGGAPTITNIKITGVKPLAHVKIV